MSDEPAGQPLAAPGLRAVVEQKDAQIVVLRARLEAEQEARRRLELRLEELERRLGSDSSDSGTPTSMEGIGAKAARKARRAAGVGARAQ